MYMSYLYMSICISIIIPRLALTILLVLSRNMVYVIEQPRDSLLIRHRRMDWLANKVTRVTWPNALLFSNVFGIDTTFLAQVYQCIFWMMLHGSGSPKPTVCYSNMSLIQKLYRGALRKGERERRTIIQTTRNLDDVLRPNGFILHAAYQLLTPCDLDWGKYVDSKGKKRFVGTPALRTTQNPGSDSHDKVICTLSLSGNPTAKPSTWGATLLDLPNHSWESLKSGVLLLVVCVIYALNHNLKGTWTQLSNSTDFPWGIHGRMQTCWSPSSTSSSPSCWG